MLMLSVFDHQDGGRTYFIPPGMVYGQLWARGREGRGERKEDFIPLNESIISAVGCRSLVVFTFASALRSSPRFTSATSLAEM